MLHQKEKKDQFDKNQDLLKDLALRFLQTVFVLNLPNDIPQEEKKTISGLLDCASAILFRISLMSEKDLSSVSEFLLAATAVKEHLNDVQDISLKYAPKLPNKIGPHSCPHPISKRANDFDEILKSFGKIEPMMDELRKYKTKETFHRLKKYHDKA